MSVQSFPAARFPLGRTVATRNAIENLTWDDILAAIRRHQVGDWGDICADDRKENDLSLEKSFCLLSVYRSSAGIKFWIITEADRSVTTVLMPEDY